jgi:hypothetical protein
VNEFAKGGIIPPGHTIAVNRTGRPEIVLTTAQAEAKLAEAQAKLDDLDTLVATPAEDEDLKDWVCARCERGQCGRCADPDCTCCNGNPGELWLRST